MNQMVIHMHVERPAPRYRIAVVCTLCGKEVYRVNGREDCGTPHRAGTAQMQYQRVPL